MAHHCELGALCVFACGKMRGENWVERVKGHEVAGIVETLRSLRAMPMAGSWSLVVGILGHMVIERPTTANLALFASLRAAK